MATWIEDSRKRKRRRKNRREQAASAAAIASEREAQLAAIPPPPVIQIAAATPAGGGSAQSASVASTVEREKIADEESPEPWRQPRVVGEAQLAAEEAGAQSDMFFRIGLVALGGLGIAYFAWGR